MAYNTYGYRYPGGRSIIEGPWTLRDDSIVRRKDKKAASGKKRSPKRIDENAFASLKKGMRIHHSTLGDGTVVSVEAGRALIRFDKSGASQFLKRKSINKNARLIGVVGASDAPSKGAKKAPARQAASKPLGRNPEAEAWSRKKKAFLGCQVRDRYRKVGLVTSIVEGKMKVLFLPKGIEEEFVYPSAFVEGALVVLDRPDTSVQQSKQQYAAMAMKDLMDERRSPRGGK